MKSSLIKYLLVLLSLYSSSTIKAQNLPSPHKNYILTYTPQIAVSNISDISTWQCLQTIDYFDEWGRKQQTVQKGITPQGEDLATYHEYDTAGNPYKNWLPTTITGNAGKFVPLDNLKSNSNNTYDGDKYAYSLDVYEESPLKRIIEKYAPGEYWVGDPTGCSYTYTILPSTSICHYMAYDGSCDTIVNIKLSGMYAIGELLVESKVDEDSDTTKVYTDKEGRCIMEEKNGLCTYYVYDDRSRLRAVLPPQLSAALTTAESTWNNASSKLLRQYAYLYTYDGENRCSHKRSPSTSWLYCYYDKSGKLILSQDGNQRKNGECTFTIPDTNGRVVLTGVCRNTCPAFSNPLKNIIVRAIRNNQTNVTKGYGISGFTLISPVIQFIRYYDDYDFMGKNNIPTSVERMLSYEVASGYGTRYTGNPIGFQTGEIIQLTDESYIYRVMYYDERGRLIQKHSTNHMGGSEHIWYNRNFTGKVIKNKSVRTATGKNSLTEIYDYYFDHSGRLTDVYHQLDNNVRIKLLSYTYDELGRMVNRKVHNLSSSSLNYRYNIRNWLLKIDGELFKETLYYNGNEPYNNPFSNYSNKGNICGMTWQSGNEKKLRGYEFFYDRQDRLTTAKYAEGTNTKMDLNSNRYTEQVTGYDKNGNILALQRYGQTGASSYGLIDNLTFTLNGNQLNRVDDAVTSSAYNNGFEFKDAVKQANEYAYDANGNLTKDLNKNISNIQYNCLNLPSKATFTDGSTIEYTYAADGTKLRTKHVINGTTTTTDYCGNVIYENGVQKLLLTEAGYLTLADSKYHYYLQDHQGNNRVVIDQNGTVEETNHYYPFGGVFANSTSVQPYKYNGKELDTKKGLNWYDYGARHYDAAIGRFATVDPMGEKYYPWSPYTYCLDNPIKYVDNDGKKVYYATGVSNEFKNDFKQAVQYLNQNGAGGLLAKLHASDKIYYIDEGLPLASSSFNKDTQTITWSSRTGLLTNNGFELSPTTVLNHEIDHAVQFDQNHEQQMQDYNSKDENYSNKEEKRVITGSEQETAKKLGEIDKTEVTRIDHLGTLYETTGPTTIEWKDPIVITPKKK